MKRRPHTRLHLRHQRQVIVRLKERVAVEEFEQDDPERVEIRAVRELIPAQLLWAHITELTFHDPRLGLLDSVFRLGDAKVDHLHRTREADHDVRWREVAVHHAELFAAVVDPLRRVMECSCAADGDGDGLGLAEGKALATRALRAARILPQQLTQRPPGHELVDEVALAVRLVVVELEQLGDVRWLSATRAIRQHVAELAFSEVAVEALDRDRLMKPSGSSETPR